MSLSMPAEIESHRPGYWIAHEKNEDDKAGTDYDTVCVTASINIGKEEIKWISGLRAELPWYAEPARDWVEAARRRWYAKASM
ncbi:hypothetical protein GCM10027278_33280 [Paralcaligenes ginsengisoli]